MMTPQDRLQEIEEKARESANTLACICYGDRTGSHDFACPARCRAEYVSGYLAGAAAQRERDAARKLNDEDLLAIAKAMQGFNALAALRDIPWDSIDQRERDQWFMMAKAARMGLEVHLVRGAAAIRGDQS